MSLGVNAGTLLCLSLPANATPIKTLATNPMTSPLHLKYRPQTLADLVGQPMTKICLTNAVQTQTIAPAYLFHGTRGTGKTSTARILAKSLNCSSYDAPTLTPCGTCSSCRSIETSSSLDVTEIDAASNGGVDSARELVQNIAFAPLGGRYRVVILDECHNLTKPAQDALLKCIEEPPPKTVFILCTTEVHKVLVTIASRCLSFEFARVGRKDIADHLQTIADTENIPVTPDALRAITQLCGGSLRDALQLLAKSALLGATQIRDSDVYALAGVVHQTELVTLIQSIRDKNIVGLLQQSRSLVDSGTRPRQLYEALLTVFRDVLIRQHSPDPDLLTSYVPSKHLDKLATTWSGDQVQQGLFTLHEAESQLRDRTNEQAWLEVMLINLSTSLSSQLPASTQPTVAPAKPNPTPPTIDPAALWQRVLNNAQPKTEAKLRKHVRFVAFNPKTNVVTLEVDPSYETTLSNNLEKMTEMVSKAAEREVTLKLKVPVLV